MWLLFHLTSAGKHLQERSALALLGEALQWAYQEDFAGVEFWSLCPVDLWSDALQEELLSSEDLGQQGSIAHAYASAISKYGTKLPQSAVRILKGIVLAAKLGLYVETRDEGIHAIAELAGMPHVQVSTLLQKLQDEFNVIEWDGNFNQFEIIGDAVPRSQFLSYLRQKIATSYDSQAKASLFATHSQEWCDLLENLDCDFAEENKISTREWQFQAVTTHLQHLETQLKFGVGEWKNAIAIDAPKGFVFYCYVEPERDPHTTALEVRKLIRRVEKEIGFSPTPVFVALLWDEEGELGQALAEMAILLEGISEEDRARFGNLIAAHQEKARTAIKNQIESMLKEQRFVTSLGDKLMPARRNRFGSELFAHVYKKPIPFPFDGFSTARGNAADTCSRLIIELLHGKLDFDAVTAKPTKEKNRALHVLNDTWGVFTSRGTVSRKPENSIIRSVVETWDRELKSDSSHFFVGQAIRRLCLPPFGANIASASLLFATYISSRVTSLMVSRDGEIHAVHQWLDFGIFRNKYLDLKAIDKDELLPAGGESSEWEELLSDWEQAESYQEQLRYLEKAVELQQRIPVPPARRDRYSHMVERSSEAKKALEKVDGQIEKSLRKMQNAYEREDLSVLSWGAASLVDIQQRMLREQPLWTEAQAESISRDIEQARQAMVQLFPGWLSSQHPSNDRPDTIGEFKHKMLSKMGGNLKTLGLDEQYEQLKERVSYLVRNAETAAEARQLVRDVNNWIYEHKEVLRNPRVSEIRGLKDVAKGYANKLRGMAQRIEMQELHDTRTSLADFTETLKAAEAKIMDRANALWDSEIKCEEDLGIILREVNSLMTAFEGLSADLEDIVLMGQALDFFQRGCKRLSRQNITWDEFDSIITDWQKEMFAALGEEELPWGFEEVISVLSKEKANDREKMSNTWITDLENSWNSMSSSPNASEANRLYEKAANPPPFVTENHREKADHIRNEVEVKLESLKIEWLVERFKEMPLQTKKGFLEIAVPLFKEQSGHEAEEISQVL